MDTAEPPLLLVAAERREFGQALMKGAKRLNWPIDFAARAGDRLLAANGAGPVRSAEAVDVALKHGPVRAVVSMGYCGALDRALQVGDIVVAVEINGIPGNIPESWRKYTAGPVVSIDRIANSAAEKAALRAGGAIAVEMEAAGVAERASRAGLPFYCVRVVTDRADETLSIDFNAVRDRSGRIRATGVLISAMRHPWDRVPELLMLARRSRLAARELGEFLADCRIE